MLCQTLLVHVMDEGGSVFLNFAECFASFLKDTSDASLPLRGGLSCSACLWSAKALRAVLVEKVPRRTTVLAPDSTRNIDTRGEKAKATSTLALIIGVSVDRNF